MHRLLAKITQQNMLYMVYSESPGHSEGRIINFIEGFDNAQSWAEHYFFQSKTKSQVELTLINSSLIKSAKQLKKKMLTLYIKTQLPFGMATVFSTKRKRYNKRNELQRIQG